MKYIFVGEKQKDAYLYDLFVKEAIAKKMMSNTHIRRMKSYGLESNHNVIKVYPGDYVYTNICADDVGDILDNGGKPIDKLLYKDKNIPYHKQLRVVLKNSGVVDPESIDDYLNRQGYQAFAKVLSSMTPDQIIEEMKTSGLRGRGGGGFPTWIKWQACQKSQGERKMVICNADEGDPGAYMDRSILEGDPYAIIEGMSICGYAVVASEGYIYCRAEYPLAISRLNKAIDAARERGLLGNNIMGTGFSFNIEVRLGAGAFVCGEETALIASIEGKRGMPRPRPPYPATKGLWDYPTNINNVETYANIPMILLKGGSWYGAIGTDESKGTKVFALTGKVVNCGLVEVPMGTPLREIVYDVGGGIKENKKLKAIQTGGPSGGMIPDQYIDTPISYESLQKLDSIMGSGGMIVMDQDDCVVDTAKFYTQFAIDESCGKCSPCRLGTTQLLNLLNKITSGHGDISNLITIKRICRALKNASLCGLGQSAPNPILSSLQYFKDEYLAHIIDQNCPTGKCKDLIKYVIDEDKCIGCTLCARNCPVDCIAGARKELHVIDQEKCIKCGACKTACKFDAVLVI